MVQHESISEVVVMHPHGPMRLLLHQKLAEAGYRVMDAPTYTAVLRHLRRATVPMVVLAGNLQATFRAERMFFARIAQDAGLARRHRFVLFCTLPEWLPDDVEAMLHGLGVYLLSAPSLAQIVAAVALAAGRPQPEQAEDEGEGESAG